MSMKNPNKYSSYFLRTQSHIINGEKFIPYDSFREKPKKRNRSSTKSKKKYSKKIDNYSSIYKSAKNNKNKNDKVRPSSYRGIDLNKVSGFSNSKNKLNNSSKIPQKKNHIISREKKIENEDNRDNEIDSKENNIQNEYKNFGDSYNTNNIILKNKPNLNFNYYNEDNNPIYNKYNKDYFLNNNQDYQNYQNCIIQKEKNKNYDLNNNINKFLNEKFNQNKNKILLNSLINEQQYQNTLPSNIPENEIINNPGESMSFTPIENLINKNKNIYQNKNELNKKNNNSKFDIYYKINKLKNEILSTDINKKTNYKTYSNFKNNNKKTYPYEDNNNLTNKENIYIKINSNDNDNYFNYYPNNNKLNNDFELKENNASKCSLKNNNDTFVSYRKNNETLPCKYLLKSVFELNSTNNYINSFSPKNRINNLTFTNYNFNYDNTFEQKQKLNQEAHNFFGIQMNGNRLNQLLKSIPSHKKENIIHHYKTNNEFLNLYKDKKKEKKNIKNNNKILIWNNHNNYKDEELNKVMPPNIINYK